MTTPLQTPVDHQYFDWSIPKQQTYRNYHREKHFSSNSHSTKKSKINDSQTSYPFQAELTQQIDIECDNIHPPTHHFTLSTVINVSVNSQRQKSSSDVRLNSLYPMKTYSDYQSKLIPYSDFNLSLYLKDLDLNTLDHFPLPSCPNPQDYLTVDGLLTFLMSDKHRLKHYRYPYPSYDLIDRCPTSTINH